MDDPYLASRIQDNQRGRQNRLLRNLAQKKYKAFSGLEAGSIVHRRGDHPGRHGH